MSREGLSASIEKLLKLHHSLYELAVKKTDIIKMGDMEALNQLLKEEQKHIASMEQVEREREKAAKAIVPDIEDPTVTNCLKVFSSLEKDKLTNLVNELAIIIQDLKEQNYLNQQLIHHSLQFVHFSMELIRPQPTNINYGPPTKSQKSSELHSLSMFSSEA